MNEAVLTRLTNTIGTLVLQMTQLQVEAEQYKSQLEQLATIEGVKKRLTELEKQNKRSK